VARLEGGQALVTTTDVEHVPGADGAEVTRVAVVEGEARNELAAAVAAA
jgi:hypothetical protein